MAETENILERFRRHENGGGFVALTAHVDASVYVGPHARIYGNAQISGNAQIYDNAQIYHNARISGNAQIYDNAQIYHNARISGNAQIYHNARIYDNARISGDAQISGDTWTETPIGGFCGRWWAGQTTKTRFVVGCQEFTLEEWLICFDEIADKYDATVRERAIARALMQLARDLP